MSILGFVFITISSDILDQETLHTARFHQKSVPHIPLKRIKAEQLLRSTVTLLHLMGEGGKSKLS